MIKSNPPCGYVSGKSWDDCGKHQISRIYVAMDANRSLVSIQFGYIDERNAVVLSDRRGGEGPIYSVVELNYPLEHLTSVTGSYNYPLERTTSVTGYSATGSYPLERTTSVTGSYNYPLERITSVTGSYQHYRITSIAFETNNSKYGPYGNQDKSNKTFKMEMGNDFYGFHGYADNYLYAIGVYLKPNATNERPKESTAL